MSMEEQAREILIQRGQTRLGWEVQDSSTLICPHGYTIEWDGKCSEGCVSPLKRLGLI